MKDKYVKSLYFVCKGKNKIGKPYKTYEEAEGFLRFLVMCRPFEMSYNIKEVKAGFILNKIYGVKGDQDDK